MTEPDRTEWASNRIVLIGPGPTARGGIAQFNTHLAEALAEAGAEAILLPLSPVYPSWTKAGRQTAVLPGPLPTGFRLAASRLVAWRPWTWWGAIRELGRVRPTAVVFQWWHPMFAPAYAFVAAVARRGGSRVLFVCHNAEPHERFLLARPLTSLALSRADALLVLSEAVERVLSDRLRTARVIRLSHPPYTAFLRQSDRSAENEWKHRVGADGRAVILFFGNVRRYKGLGDLLAAFPAVRAKTPAVLVVAGKFFESEDEYRRQVAELGLDADVKLFPGYVPDAEVAALFRASDLIVLPYRSGSQTGIAPLAAALGKPVVSTDAGGISEALPTARIAPVGDPAGLAGVIVDTLRHPQPAGPPLETWDMWARTICSLGATESSRDARGAR
jgi:glycosyltransferase involved in cell wall biosynthesis